MKLLYLGKKKGALIYVIDKTCTAMGGEDC